ncbi:hypothetical protein [Paenibacillus medicaginis]|uniref:Uncharacterized protein n=1 Tax=Paenibacillus medicaginis TaxID=1470560 RepID=A0ABV5BUR2_9BACL
MFSEMSEERAKIMKTKDSEFLVNMLFYISGFMGNDSKFQNAFDAALEDVVRIRTIKEEF